MPRECVRYYRDILNKEALRIIIVVSVIIFSIRIHICREKISESQSDNKELKLLLKLY